MPEETSYRRRYFASETYKRARKRERQQAFWSGCAPILYAVIVAALAAAIILSNAGA